MTWMYETMHKHGVSPTPQQLTEQQGLDTIFGTTKLIMNRNATGWQKNADRVAAGAFKWSLTVHPKGPGGTGGSDFEIDATSVTTATKHPQEAWEWVKFTSDQETGIRLGELVGGTVGGRPDVYRSPRLLKDSYRSVFLEAMETTQAARLPFNT